MPKFAPITCMEAGPATCEHCIHHSADRQVHVHRQQAWLLCKELSLLHGRMITVAAEAAASRQGREVMRVRGRGRVGHPI